MLNYFELYLLGVIRGERRGVIAGFLRFFLRFFSWFYHLAITLRNWAYDGGWMKRYFPPVPVVVSIGNIVAGGTGKTPVTLLFAKEFYPDYDIAILSRGYRSKAEKLNKPVFLCAGEGPVHPASFGGDEATMLARRLPKSMVLVGRNRRIASDMASKAGAQIILLDDGMQHRSLARDFEVVVLDSLDPFGLGYFLPRGFLREPVSALRRADLIILNHVSDRDRFQFLSQEIGKHSHAKVVGVRFSVTEVVDFEGNPIPDLHGKEVAIFCAIAKPETFRNTVTELGAHIAAHYFKPDHVSFTQKELQAFAKSCKRRGVEYLLCTEKDRVRIEENPELSLPIAVVQCELSIVEGAEGWREFVGHVRSDLSHKM